jgi:hypothetical protein
MANSVAIDLSCFLSPGLDLQKQIQRIVMIKQINFTSGKGVAISFFCKDIFEVT